MIRLRLVAGAAMPVAIHSGTVQRDMAVKGRACQ